MENLVSKDLEKATKHEYKHYDDVLRKTKESLKQRKQYIGKCAVELADEKKPHIERQLIASQKSIEEVINDGEELITNISAANEKREIDRREKDADARERLLASIEEENQLAQEKFNHIGKQWDELLKVKDPVSVNEGLNVQKQRITELIAQKDAIIEACQKDLMAVDMQYYYDLKRQEIDISTLSERINEQITVTRKTFKEHIELLKDAIERDRKESWQQYVTDWEQLHQYTNDDELKKRKQLAEKRQKYEDEVDKIRLNHQESIRATRIKLDQDNELLQNEVQKVKSEVMLNTEKMEYNYQVLQKRAAENATIRNEQKKKLSKLTLIVQQLNRKIKETKYVNEQEVNKITNEIIQLHSNIVSVEEKAQKFAKSNDETYLNVWNINEMEAKELVKKIESIDKVLSEEVLLFKWEPLIKDFPTISKLKSYRKAVKCLKQKNNDKPKKSLKDSTESIDSVRQYINSQTVQTILRHLASQGEFLIEDKLAEILRNVSYEKKLLVHIDWICNVLGIESFHDMCILLNYFMPYAYCPNCMNDKDLMNLRNLNEYTLKPIASSIMSENADEDVSNNKSMVDLYVKTMTSEFDEEYKQVIEVWNDPNSEDLRSSYLDKLESSRHNNCINHYLVVQPAFVNIALRNYINEVVKPNNTKSRPIIAENMEENHLTITRLLDQNEVDSFWKSIMRWFPPSKEKSWQQISFGLKQYLDVLKERSALNAEVESIRMRNRELQHLLQRVDPKMQSQSSKYGFNSPTSKQY